MIVQLDCIRKEEQFRSTKKHKLLVRDDCSLSREMKNIWWYMLLCIKYPPNELEIANLLSSHLRLPRISFVDLS